LKTLNSAVPYLYFTINPLGASATNLVSVVFDPAAPALFLDGKALAALPMGPVSVSGIGFSSQGLIGHPRAESLRFGFDGLKLLLHSGKSEIC
jgi:hypothetical protein